MHSDPFENVYKLERREIRNKKGCSSCQYKGFKAWGVYSCKKGFKVNKRGFCKYWKFNEGD